MAANAGTLTFMVGANQPSDFEKAKAVLMDMGKNVTHCGKVGSGGAVKILIQQGLGLDLKKGLNLIPNTKLIVRP